MWYIVDENKNKYKSLLLTHEKRREPTKIGLDLTRYFLRFFENVVNISRGGHDLSKLSPNVLRSESN